MLFLLISTNNELKQWFNHTLVGLSACYMKTEIIYLFMILKIYCRNWYLLNYFGQNFSFQCFYDTSLFYTFGTI